MGKKLVILSVFDKVSGLLKYDTSIEVEEDELFNVRVVDGDDLEVFSNDNELEFEGEVQGFSGETRVRGFQPKEQPKTKDKKTKKKGE